MIIFLASYNVTESYYFNQSVFGGSEIQMTCEKAITDIN